MGHGTRVMSWADIFKLDYKKKSVLNEIVMLCSGDGGHTKEILEILMGIISVYSIYSREPEM